MEGRLKRVLVGLALVLGMTGCHDDGSQAGVVEIKDGWEYRLGESPRDATGRPLWVAEEHGWTALPASGLPDGAASTLWLRVRLPRGPWRDPLLVVTRTNQVPDVELYVGPNRLYRAAGSDLLKWSVFRLVPLSEAALDEPLTLRLSAPTRPRCVLGSASAQVRSALRKDIPSLLVAGAVGLLGLVSLLVFMGSRQRLHFGFAVLALGAAGMLGVLTFACAWLLDVTSWRRVLAIFVNYAGVIGLGLVVESLAEPSQRALPRWSWRLALGYFTAEQVLGLGGFVPWPALSPPRHLVYTASFGATCTSILVLALRGNPELRLAAPALAIGAASGIVDLFLDRANLLDGRHMFLQWGALLFLSTLVWIMVRRYLDVHQRVKAYARELEDKSKLLADKNQELERLDQLKDEFLANTSHELRTPLNGINGIAESLLDGAGGPLPGVVVSNLGILLGAGRRLASLVGDLLDFSKLRHHTVDLKRGPVDLHALVEIVLALSRPLVGTRPVVLLNAIPAPFPAAEADEDRLQQILHNLVGNAIKFTSEGTIEVSAAHDGERVTVTVSDTGIGIPLQKQARIFEPFEQADGSVARQYGGTGLGLAVSRQLVALHGGTMHLESTLGFGSRFSFTLPRSAQALDAARRRPAIEVARTRRETDPQGIPASAVASQGARFRVLAVDDEPANLQVLTNYLALEGYEVATAQGGQEALDLLAASERMDVVLLDVMMPRMSGLEVVARLRQSHSAHELPILLLTARDQVTDLVEGFGAGANDYLTKPVSRRELAARLRTHLELAKVGAACRRFVPSEFLRFLGHDSIVDVSLGDQVMRRMTVLFADIRDFTALSERMSPAETFSFLNACLGRVGPLIRQHGGFIDKYLGDGIMALFPEGAGAAVETALGIQQEVDAYNQARAARGEAAIRIGIGIHCGELMLGVLGERQRLEATVIADAVNLTSRIEGLTKVFGSSILVSDAVASGLAEGPHFERRRLGRVDVKGRRQGVDIFEIFACDPEARRAAKRATQAELERGLESYVAGRPGQASAHFERVLELDPSDVAARAYLRLCHERGSAVLEKLDR